MKAKLPIIIGLIITIAIAVFYGYYNNGTCKYYDNNVNTAVYQDIGILQPGQQITQVFTSQADRIDAIQLKCNVSGDHAQVEVEVELYDNETGELVGSCSESGANIKARKQHTFPIETITGCNGKSYTVKVTESGSTDANGIIFQYQPNEEYQEGLQVDDNTLHGVLIMKTLSTDFNIQSFIVMLISLWIIWGFMWFLARLFK